MKDALGAEIAELTGASRAVRTERVETVWSGYGEVVRYSLEDAEPSRVVVKHIVPGKGRGRSHDRKLRSYEVEQTWYRDWSRRCSEDCRVARCFHAQRRAGEWLFVFEDLDDAGFPGRTEYPSGRRLETCLRWLASFHATFLGQRPKGLWKTGTYWHLATRPDEHRAMPRGPLRDAASAIDARLSAARHLTLVHGDAKPSNFCFSADGRRAVAVDFQYVGGGCGMKDLAYLLAGEDEGTVRRALDVYFRTLRERVAGPEGAALETEWRALYPFAWADFQRFLAGWAPQWRFRGHELALTRKALASL